MPEFPLRVRRRLPAEFEVSVRRALAMVRLEGIGDRKPDQLSDRIAVFNNGIIEQLDSPARLYEQPATGFVAGFTGESNVLDGTVRAVDCNGVCKVEIAGASLTVGAVAGRPAVVGDARRLYLRPERVQIDPTGPLDTVIDARIDDVAFLGEHIRLLCSVAASRDFLLKVPNTPAGQSLAPGITVRIGWMQHDCRAL